MLIPDDAKPLDPAAETAAMRVPSLEGLDGDANPSALAGGPAEPATVGFALVSDPAQASEGLFGPIGFEANGVFCSSAGKPATPTP